MMWLWIILALMVILAAVVLFSPIIIDVDSEEDRYVIRYGYLVIGRLLVIEGDLGVRLSVLGFRWQKRLEDILASMRNRPSTQKEEGKTSSANKVPVRQKIESAKFSWKKTRAVVRTIECRKLELDLDTGSYVRNAWLFPLFFLVSKRNRKLRINFTGNNIIHAYVRAVPARVLWAFVHT